MANFGYEDDGVKEPRQRKPKRNFSDNLTSFINKTFKFTFKSATLLIIIIVAVFAGQSTFYKVGATEQAVIKRFGKVVNVTGPGAHFKLPYPIETEDRASVTEIHRIEIGYRSGTQTTNDRYRIETVGSSNPDESMMLTSDENIVSVDFIVQYRIRDIVEYLFNLQDVEASIQLAAEASIREVAGKTLIDDLLTTGRETVQEQTKLLIQEILDKYDAGVQIVAVELQDIEPPAEVIGAFQDVASSREDKNKFINEAQAYENQKIPMARAQAATVVMEAESYKAIILGRAEGEAARFMQVYESYKQAPDITRRRMYLEAMEQIIATSEILVVDETLNNMNVFTNMDQVMNKAAAGQAGEAQ